MAQLSSIQKEYDITTFLSSTRTTMSRPKQSHAVIMITGTTVGTGVLGLPIITSEAGFMPTMIAFIVAWIFMTQAALYILDAKMHYRNHYNLSSLIKLTLGKTGQYASSLIILLLLYSLLCTYIMTGAAWLKILCGTQLPLSLTHITFLFVLVFGSLVFLKKNILYSLNNVLGIGLGLAFIIMVSLSLWPINLKLIQHMNPPAILSSMPLLLTTFGFSIVVPAVTEYLEYDARATKSAIIIGSLIAFLAYFVWEWVTLGHIPLTGPLGFHFLNQHGDDGTGVIHAFTATTPNQWATSAGQFFAIFADITSFLGVSLALIHCLDDLTFFKTPRTKHWIVTVLTFMPPLVVTLLYPKSFIQILSFAGLAVALLLGLLPALMNASMYFSACPKSQLWASLLNRHFIMICCSALFFISVMVIELHNLLA